MESKRVPKNVGNGSKTTLTPPSTNNSGHRENKTLFWIFRATSGIAGPKFPEDWLEGNSSTNIQDR